jgi:hypothetical protein
MHLMTCRLYGRFVMVEREAGDKDRLILTFLLPHMTFGNSGLREHHGFMTIARHFVDHKKTTLPPTFRTIADGNANEAEDFIWDLTGWEVDFGVDRGVKVTAQTGKEIPDLAELERKMNRDPKLRTETDLRPGLHGIVRAAVTIGRGDAKARAAFPTPSAAFNPLSDPKKAGDPIITPRFHTDIIDIELPPADAHRVILREGATEAHITLKQGKNEKGEEVVPPAVAISNLCSELPHAVKVDFEFAQYYRVLQDVAPDRLVPIVSASAGDEDCNRQARIRV